MPLGPVVKHKTAGVIFDGVQAADAVLDRATRFWQFQHSPFIDYKLVWELLRVTYTWNLDTAIPVAAPAGTATSANFGAYLFEDPLDTPSQLPFQRPAGTTPLPTESAFDLEHAFENNTRILDQWGFSTSNFVDSLAATAAVAYAWVTPNIHTNVLPRGVIVVPEFVGLYARVNLDGFGTGNSVLSCWGTLDYIEHLVPTAEKLQLAGLTSTLVLTRT